MRARLEGILARYGQDAVLTDRETGGERRVRAFVQPVLKKREDLPAQATALGAVSRERWLYIGGGSQSLRAGDGVACGGLRLVVQEARPGRWGDEVLYYWAVLRQERRNAAE